MPLMPSCDFSWARLTLMLNHMDILVFASCKGILVISSNEGISAHSPCRRILVISLTRAFWSFLMDAALQRFDETLLQRLEVGRASPWQIVLVIEQFESVELGFE